MNLSARWTRVSFPAFAAVAALAAGALAFGCTVTTGNVDDLDGGSGSNFDVDAATDSGGNTVDPGTDAGTTPDDAAPTAVCADNNQPANFFAATCQACLDTSCCSQLKGCFNLDPGTDGDGGKNATCAEYAEYYTNTCQPDCAAASPDGGAEYDQCLVDCRAASGNPAIADAYEAVLNCASDNCATACGGE